MVPAGISMGVKIKEKVLIKAIFLCLFFHLVLFIKHEIMPTLNIGIPIPINSINNIVTFYHISFDSASGF